MYVFLHRERGRSLSPACTVIGPVWLRDHSQPHGCHFSSQLVMPECTTNNLWYMSESRTPLVKTPSLASSFRPSLVYFHPLVNVASKSLVYSTAVHRSFRGFMGVVREQMPITVPSVKAA